MVPASLSCPVCLPGQPGLDPHTLSEPPQLCPPVLQDPDFFAPMGPLCLGCLMRRYPSCQGPAQALHEVPLNSTPHTFALSHVSKATGLSSSEAGFVSLSSLGAGHMGERKGRGQPPGLSPSAWELWALQGGTSRSVVL